MKKGWVLLMLVGVMLFGFSGGANADLTTIGTATYGGSTYKLIYEGEIGGSGLVWLDYTKGDDTRQNQMNWAAGLNNQGVLTYNLNPGISVSWAGDWRLPITDESQANMSGGFGYAGPDANGYHNYMWGYNMVNSEMGHLYYESLENKGAFAKDGTYRPLGWGLRNTGDFNNLLADGYWSGTEYSLNPGTAWLFDISDGNLLTSTPGGQRALAVRPAAVPEPSTMILLGLGLVGLAGIGRKLKS